MTREALIHQIIEAAFEKTRTKRVSKDLYVTDTKRMLKLIKKYREKK